MQVTPCTAGLAAAWSRACCRPTAAMAARAATPLAIAAVVKDKATKKAATAAMNASSREMSRLFCFAHFWNEEAA